ATLKDYMTQQGIEYEVLSHPHSHSSTETAKLTHVPAERLAKAVVLEDDKGWLMAVLPASYHIQLNTLSERLERDLKLAVEPRLKQLFKDCEPGAIPPVGQAYGMDTIVDESLTEQPDLYFESGDHEELIHVQGDAFMKIMANTRRGRFSAPTL
ncbi:MAG TPA: YbaK/EbsC family protein, partial [Burkholderiales bacterium]|nr:YbaK/EbsC family protein [Burkholderiales bacterium]